MEMPTRCFACPMCEISDDEICCSISIGVAVSYKEIDEQIAIQDRPSWCPLVSIPPHGRLIDADALDSSETDFLGNHLVYLVDIDDAPTIIPADESDMDSFIRIFEEDEEEDGLDSFIRILKD